MSRESVVYIAARYGLGGHWFESR